MRVTFYSLPKRFNKAFFRKVVAITLKKENRLKAAMAIVFLNRNQIEKLNFSYRGEKGPTDVLSFSSKAELFPKEDKDYLGELAVCLSCIEENARKFKQPLKKELARVLIHGILHLLGYNHGRDKTMIAKQEAYLSLISLIHQFHD